MKTEREPRKGHGYIYILSNPSMQGIYKIGLTENSVSRRITELSGTGVPTRFNAEKVFEIDVRFLRTVERSVHNELKKRGHHHSKEFFRTSLFNCVTCVEDAILSITGVQSLEIVGEALKRRERAEHRREWEEEEQARRRNVLASLNDETGRRREAWITEQLPNRLANSPENSSEQVVFVALAGGAIIIGAFSVIGPGAGLFTIAATSIWWCANKKAASDRIKKELLYEAAKQFRMKSIDDIPRLAYAEPMASEYKGSTETSHDANRGSSKGSKESSGYTTDSPRHSRVIREIQDRAIHRRRVIWADVEHTPQSSSQGTESKSRDIPAKVIELSDRAIHGRVPSTLPSNRFESSLGNKYQYSPGLRRPLGKEMLVFSRTGSVSIELTPGPLFSEALEARQAGQMIDCLVEYDCASNAGLSVVEEIGLQMGATGFYSLLPAGTRIPCEQGLVIAASDSLQHQITLMVARKHPYGKVTSLRRVAISWGELGLKESAAVLMIAVVLRGQIRLKVANLGQTRGLKILC